MPTFDTVCHCELTRVKGLYPDNKIIVRNVITPLCRFVLECDGISCVRV
jgi:hypothetical protein